MGVSDKVECKKFTKLPRMSDAVFYELRTKAMKNKTTMLDEVNKLYCKNKLHFWGDYISGFEGKKSYQTPETRRRLKR